MPVRVARNSIMSFYMLLQTKESVFHQVVHFTEKRIERTTCCRFFWGKNLSC